MHPFAGTFAALALIAAILLLSGCGGMIVPPRTAEPESKLISITADEVFSSAMVGQTWFFEGTCGGDVRDPAGKLLATFPVQPFHTTIAIRNGTAFTYTKDVDCGYWALGVKDAVLFDFALEQDNGGWYNTGGHIVMPFGCPWCDPGKVDVFYTVPPSAIGGPRPYLIIPPRGDNRNKVSVKTDYAGTPWETDSYVEMVTTPVYSGPALVSEQIENACAHEKWYFAPGLGLVQVNALFVAGCSGLQTDVIMKRVKVG